MEDRRISLDGAIDPNLHSHPDREGAIVRTPQTTLARIDLIDYSRPTRPDKGDSVEFR